MLKIGKYIYIYKKKMLEKVQLIQKKKKKKRKETSMHLFANTDTISICTELLVSLFWCCFYSDLVI